MADIPTSNGVMTTNSTGLADLPLELILKIFRDTLLNSGRDLHNLTITCKALHFTFKCHQKYILSVILDEQSDEDLAMSSARYHAAMAPWRDVKDFEAPALRNLPAYHRHVKEFCSDHISRQGTQLTIPRSLFTLGMVTHFQEHHPPIQRMAAELVKLVVEGRVDPRPSSAEVRRVVKSLWILDLVQILFPKTWAPGTTLQEDPISPFWSCFAPWESDQVQWVADRLADNLRYFTDFTGTSIWQNHVIRVLMMRDIKSLESMICHGRASRDDTNLVRDYLGNTAYRVFRDKPWGMPHSWFFVVGEYDTYGCTAVVGRDVIERFDAEADDGPVRAWLWNVNAFGGWWGAGPGSPYILELSKLFWDHQHLVQFTRGALHPLEHYLTPLIRNQLVLLAPLIRQESRD